MATETQDEEVSRDGGILSQVGPSVQMSGLASNLAALKDCRGMGMGVKVGFWGVKHAHKNKLSTGVKADFDEMCIFSVFEIQFCRNRETQFSTMQFN